jgi:hypothetical protein
MSALPPKADINERYCHVRFVPKADIAPLSLDHQISELFKESGNRQPKLIWRP